MSERNNKLGTYFFPPNLYEDSHMQTLADMGVDFIVSVSTDSKLINLCEKYGLKAIVNSNIPMWWGDNGQNAGQLKNFLPIDSLKSIKDDYVNRKPILGDYLIDEPNSGDFYHINELIKVYRKQFPGKLPFINLYPNYATTLTNNDENAISQLGNTTYEEHVTQFVNDVDTNYICFDYYPYIGEKPFGTYLENLDIVSRICSKSGRDMWVIMQTGARKTELMLEEFQIRWQAYLSMAYGASVLIHACYFKGWWHEDTTCINSTGDKNDTYYYVKKVNCEIQSLSKSFCRYKLLGVYACGNFVATDIRIRSQLISQNDRNKRFNGFENIKIDADGALIVGCFTEKKGNSRALMIVNTQNPFKADASVNVKLQIPSGLKATMYEKGLKTEIEIENPKIILNNGDGVWITVNKF